MTPNDLAAHARALLDTNGFLTLGTVDPDGRRRRARLPPVPPLPGDSDRRVGPVPARAETAVPAARSRKRPPNPHPIATAPASRNHLMPDGERSQRRCPRSGTDSGP